MVGTPTRRRSEARRWLTTTQGWSRSSVRTKAVSQDPSRGADGAGAPPRPQVVRVQRVVPLMYLPDDDDPDVIYIFASKAGAPTNPEWYYNLLAAGTTEVERGRSGTRCPSTRSLATVAISPTPNRRSGIRIRRVRAEDRRCAPSRSSRCAAPADGSVDPHRRRADRRTHRHHLLLLVVSIVRCTFPGPVQKLLTGAPHPEGCCMAVVPRAARRRSGCARPIAAVSGNRRSMPCSMYTVRRPRSVGSHCVVVIRLAVWGVDDVGADAPAGIARDVANLLRVRGGRNRRGGSSAVSRLRLRPRSGLAIMSGLLSVGELHSMHSQFHLRRPPVWRRERVYSIPAQVDDVVGARGVAVGVGHGRFGARCARRSTVRTRRADVGEHVVGAQEGRGSPSNRPTVLAQCPTTSSVPRASRPPRPCAGWPRSSVTVECR